jgi:hypothetical protein
MVLQKLNLSFTIVFWYKIMTLLLDLIRGQLFRWVHRVVLGLFGLAFALCGTIAVALFFKLSGQSVLVTLAWAVAALVLYQVGDRLHFWFLKHQEIEPGLWAIPPKPRQLSIFNILRDKSIAKTDPELFYDYQRRYNQGERWN